MDFNKFIEWAFQGLLAGAAVYGVNVLSSIKNSVNELNAKIAIIIEKTAWHEKWLEKHDEEIKKIKDYK